MPHRSALLWVALVVACSKPSAESSKPTAASVVASASVAPPASAPAPAKKPTSLDDFLPASLGGIPRMKAPSGDFAPTPPDAVAAYLSPAAGRSINVNLMHVQDLKFSRAQFHGLGPGQTKDNRAAKLAFKGFDVAGFKVERIQYLSESKKSEARALLADKVDVTVSVQPANDADEAIDLIRQLDLAGIEAFAKTM